MPRYKLRTLLILVAAISIYGGAYSAAMKPTIYASESSGGMVVAGYHAPGYRVNVPILRVVFWPMAWLDQKVRPGLWGPYSDVPSNQ